MLFWPRATYVTLNKQTRHVPRCSKCCFRSFCEVCRGNESLVVLWALKCSQIDIYWLSGVLINPFCITLRLQKHISWAAVNLSRVSQITTRTHPSEESFFSFILWQQVRKETEVWLPVNSDDGALLTYTQQAAGWSLNRRHLRHEKTQHIHTVQSDVPAVPPGPFQGTGSIKTIVPNLFSLLIRINSTS